MNLRYKKAGISRSVVIIAVVVVIIIVAAGAFIALNGATTTTTTSTTTTTTTTTTQATPTSTTTSAQTTPSSSTTTSTSAASSSSSSSQQINIGNIQELSGTTSTIGQTCLVATQAAVTEINANGGINGVPINLITLDDQTNPSQAAADARQLVTQDHVVALFGACNSVESAAVGGVAEQLHVPYVDALAGTPTINTNTTRWSFRLITDGITAGADATQFVQNTVPNAKIAIIYTQTSISEQEAAGSKWLIQNHPNGTQLAYYQGFPATQSDFSSAVAAIKSSGANFVEMYLVGAGEGVFYQELLQAGFQSTQVMNMFEIAYWVLALGSQGVGSYAVSAYTQSMGTSNAAAGQFNTLMLQALNSNPTIGKIVDQSCYYNYMGTQLLASALRQATNPLNSTDVRNAISSLNYHDPILDLNITFTSTGAPLYNGLSPWYNIMQITAINSTAWTAQLVSNHASFPPGYIPVDQLMLTLG